MTNPPQNGAPYERCRNQQRNQTDRRGMIRFELDKEPRRSGKDSCKQKDLWEGRN
jgi:hypothetical protein